MKGHYPMTRLFRRTSRRPSPCAAGPPGCSMRHGLQILLNADPVEVAGPLTVSELLGRLEIDARRVAVEHNLVVLKRQTFADTLVRDGDQIEIVNFVGGG